MIAKTETLDGCKILRVSGRIDFESALDFEHHINAMIQEGGDCYIIELSQVELLSSAGLRVMLSTAKRVAHRNASLALAAPSQVVRQVFEISHFNLLFKIYPSVSAAIAALKGANVAVQTDESTLLSSSLPSLSGQDAAKSPTPVVPRVEPAVKPSIEQKVEAERPESLPPAEPGPPKVEEVRSESLAPVVPVLPAVVDTRSVEVPPSAVAPNPPAITRPAETPPPLPPSVVESSKTVASTGVPEAPRAQPPRQTQPPPATKQSVPVSPTPDELRAARPAGQSARREAKFPAQLEVRAEGASYPCKDGDVIGTEGRFGESLFRPDYKSRAATPAYRPAGRSLVCFDAEKRAASVYHGRSCAACRRKKAPAICRTSGRVQWARFRIPTHRSTAKRGISVVALPTETLDRFPA